MACTPTGPSKLNNGRYNQLLCSVEDNHAAVKTEAVIFSKFCQEQRKVRPAIQRDKAAYYDRRAQDAQHAADQGNITTTFKMIKELSGDRGSSRGVVKDVGGNTISDEHGAKIRWQEHFRDVFGARIADGVAQTTRRVSSVSTHNFRPSVGKVSAEIQRLGNGKGVGPDGISAELMKAGGSIYAHVLHGLIDA